MTFSAEIVDVGCKEGAKTIDCRLENRYHKLEGTEQTQKAKTTESRQQKQVFPKREAAWAPALP
jgi:hypothetical protein